MSGEGQDGQRNQDQPGKEEHPFDGGAAARRAVDQTADDAACAHDAAADQQIDAGCKADHQPAA